MCHLALPSRAIPVSGALALAFFVGAGGFWSGLVEGIRATSSRIRVHVPSGIEAQSVGQARAPHHSIADLAQKWRVVETAVADDPRQSSALVQDVWTGELKTCRMKDPVGTGRVVSIQRMHVVVDVQGEFAVLDASSDPMPVVKIDSRRLAALLRSKEEKVLTDPSALVSSFPRCGLDHVPVLDNLAMGARRVPSFHPSGFKVFSIRPGSIYSVIGLRNGDIIRRINGYEIDTPDKALEVYAKLKDAKLFDVDIERDGRPLKHQYVLE